MPPGALVTFEGLDGSGKTTQLKLLQGWLQSRGIPVLATRQPGGTSTGDAIRALLLNSRTRNLSPPAELAFMFADRAQLLEEVVSPALKRNEVVLCDRFTDSTEAYQGGGRRLGSRIVLELHKSLCAGLTPTLTFLLLPYFKLALDRARGRNRCARQATGQDESRFEAEGDDFYNLVLAKYREIAERDRDRVIVIQGEEGVEEVHRRIVASVQGLPWARPRP